MSRQPYQDFTPEEYYTIQLATFGAQVLQIVANAKADKEHRGQKAYHEAQRLIPHLPRIKNHLYRTVSVAIGGATDSSQDVLQCVLCQAKFRRNQERHLPSCPYGPMAT